LFRIQENLDTLSKVEAQAVANGQASSSALSVLMGKAVTERFELCEASGAADEENRFATLTSKRKRMRVDKLDM